MAADQSYKTSTRYKKACDAFTAISRQDPETKDGQAMSEIYHTLLTKWTELLCAHEDSQVDLNESLMLASKCQHIKRWEIQRSSFADNLAGYKKCVLIPLLSIPETVVMLVCPF